MLVGNVKICILRQTIGLFFHGYVQSVFSGLKAALSSAVSISGGNLCVLSFSYPFSIPYLLENLGCLVLLRDPQDLLISQVRDQASFAQLRRRWLRFRYLTGM